MKTNSSNVSGNNTENIVGNSVCPKCLSNLRIPESIMKEKKIHCPNCGNEYPNPYYVNDDAEKGCIGCFYIIVIVVFILAIFSIFYDDKEESESSQSSWIVDSEYQAEEKTIELERNSSYIDDVEERTNSNLQMLFNKYVGVVQPNQEMMRQNPLKTILIDTFGEDIYNTILTYSKSQEWVVVDNLGFTFYDCYRSMPDGDHFCMSFIQDKNGEKSFGMEVKIGKTMYSLEINP